MNTLHLFDLPATLLDEVSDLIFVLEGDYRLCYVNRVVERLLGWSRDELAGRHALEMVPPDELAHAQAILAEAHGKAELCFEVRVLTRAGATRTLRARCRATWLPDGTLERATAIGQDVTEQVALEQAHTRRATHFAALMEQFQRQVAAAPPLALLQGLLETAIATIPDAQRGSILLLRDDGFHFIATVGWPLDELQGLVLPHTDDRNDVFRQGAKVIRLYFNGQDRYCPPWSEEIFAWLRRVGTGEIAVTVRSPILLEGELYGYINLDNLHRPDAFDDLASEALILFAGQAAVSLKYQRLLDQLNEAREAAQRQATRQALLVRIASIINSTLDIHDVLDTSMQLIGEALHAHQAGVVLFDRSRDQGQVVARWNGWDEPLREPIHIPLSQNASVQWLCDHRRPLAIDDALESPYFQTVQHVVRAHNIRSMLLLPLIIHDEVVGSIGLDAVGEPRHFWPDEVEVAQTIAQQISVAVERAGLYEQAQQRLAQIEALHEINLQSTASLELSATLHITANSVLQIVQADNAHIFQYDEASGRFEFGAFAFVGADQADNRTITVQPNGLVATVARERRMVLIEEWATHPLVRHRLPSVRAESAAGVPLLAFGQVVGVLTIAFAHQRHRFTPDELRLLELFAGHAATAIYNARLFERERVQRASLEVLHRTALSLTATRDGATLRARAIEEGLTLFDADAAAFWGWDSGRETIVILEQRGLSATYGETRRLSHGYFAAHRAQLDEPLLLNNIGVEGIYGNAPAVEEGLRHALSVPIRSGAEWLGALALYRRDEARPFNADDLWRAQTLAAQLALGLDNAKLFEQAHQRARQLMALNEVLFEVSSEIEVETTLRAIAERAAALVGANGAAIFLREPRTDTIRLAMATYPIPPNARLGASERRLAEAIRQGQPLTIDDYEQWEGRSTRNTGNFLGMIVAPLRQGDTAVGALVVTRPRGAQRFTPDDQWLVELFSRQAAVALARARLVGETQQRLQAMTRLRRATLAISQQLDVAELLQTVVEHGCALLGCEQGFFFRASPDVPASLTYIPIGNQPEPAPAPMVTALAEQIMATRRSLVLPSDEWRGAPAGPMPAMVVGLPLLYGERLLGCLVLLGEQPLPRDEQLPYILNLFATHAAVAFENALLYQQSEALKKFHENIIQWMDEGILLLDATGTIRYANRAIETLLGYEPGTLVGQRNVDLIFPEDISLVRHQRRLRFAGQASRYELSLRTRAGQPLPMIISAKPLFDSAGRYEQTLVVFTDVSERKRLEQQLRQADKLSAMGELVSGVAHELNNPLTAIIGYAQLIELAEPGGETAREVQRIHSEARRAARIVQNLLAFARQHKAERQQVNLNELLQGTLDLRAYQLKVQGIVTQWKLLDELPVTAGDPHQLQQVFLNLLVNAEQAMTANGRAGGTLTIETDVVATDQGPHLSARISDTGPGMSAQTMAHIFDPFFTTKEVGQGTGLGLSICFGIIQEHGGTITVESEPQRGSTFTVLLPIIKKSAPLPTAPLSHAPIELPADRRVLVVDDEPSVGLMLTQVLRLHGFQVTVAPTAEEALQVLRDCDQDVILCDMKMPGHGGEWLWATLRRAQPDLATRLVFMTGDTASADTRRFLEQAGRPFLAKPFRMEEMLSVVQAVLVPEATARR